MNPIIKEVNSIREIAGNDSVVMHIVAHDVSKEYTEDNYKNLVRDCVSSGCVTKEGWEEYLHPFELQVLEWRERAGEQGLKTKSGKWKISKVSHNSTYRSNKSVIGSALDAGIGLLDANGEPVGKSAIEKALKGDTIDGASSVRKSAYERCVGAANTIVKLWGELDLQERDNIRETLKGGCV